MTQDGCPIRIRCPAATPPLSPQIFDQQSLVTRFVVDQLVHHVAGQQYAEPPGTHAQPVANFRVLEWRVSGVGDGRVRQLLEGKAASWIANVIDHGSLCPYVG